MYIEKLKSQLWKTRKSRINASERMYKFERHMQFFNIYYSCIILSLSIVSLIKSTYFLSLITIISSVILTLLITFLNSQRYSQRAGELKANYIELQKLSLVLEHLTDDKIEKVCEIEEKYCNLLSQCENHREIDYLKVKALDEKLTLLENINYWGHKIIVGLLYFLLISLPLAGILTYIYCSVIVK